MLAFMARAFEAFGAAVMGALASVSPYLGFGLRFSCDLCFRFCPSFRCCLPGTGLCRPGFAGCIFPAFNSLNQAMLPDRIHKFSERGLDTLRVKLRVRHQIPGRGNIDTDLPAVAADDMDS